MKFFINGKQVILKRRRGSKITTVTNHRMERGSSEDTHRILGTIAEHLKGNNSAHRDRKY